MDRKKDKNRHFKQIPISGGIEQPFRYVILRFHIGRYYFITSCFSNSNPKGADYIENSNYRRDYVC